MKCVDLIYNHCEIIRCSSVSPLYLQVGGADYVHYPYRPPVHCMEVSHP